MRFILYYVFLRWYIRIVFSAASDPIETLFVNIEGDFSNLLEAADEGVDKTKDKLEELDDTGQKTGQGLKSSAGIAGLAFGLAAGGAAKLLDAVVALAKATVQFFADLGRQTVQANAQFETFATQFETLLGSAGAARGRLEELAQFGVETPFELPEIVEASRQLQVFGGTALATGDNLRMIGDIAAGVNQPFQSVAFWIGRMYDAMQNGQPFGEASARLQEMGALSGDTRRKLEQMQKAGEDGAKIFAVFSDEVGGRFTGNMERLSGTFQGVISNLQDFRGNLLRVGGEKFFEIIRQSAKDFLDFLNENDETITNIATGIGDLAASVVKFGREAIGGINFGGLLSSLQKFVDWLNRTTRAFFAATAITGKFFESLKPLFNLLTLGIRTALAPQIKIIQTLRGGLERLDEALVTLAKLLALSTAGWKGMIAAVAPVAELLSTIGKSVAAFFTGRFVESGQLARKALEQVKGGLIDIDAANEAINKSIKESAETINSWVDPVEDVKEAFEEGGDAAEDMGDKVEALLDPKKVESFTEQLIEATDRRNEQLQELEQKHAEKLADIQDDANKKRLGIDKKFSDDLAKLAKDSEEKRLDVIEDTRQKLADLAEETDRSLAAKRKDFNKDELRETEDHLKDMRRLQEDYLFNLEDAVRERDAGAIVDLQRQFQKESGRKEEDFQTNQSRQKSDFQEDLDAVRQNEKDKREEILAAQAEALEDIRKNEEEKKFELEMRRQEEMQKLEENLQEKLERENQNYLERQAALDEALQKQLEAIAKNLADERDVTEEGAKQILETFNEYFGIGGNIDQLMEQFSRRRRIKAEVAVEFEPQAPPPSQGAGKTTGAGAFGGRIGGPSEFAGGGTLVAQKPTLAMFGETPEIVQFTPMSQLSSPGTQEPGRMIIEMTGSAPPGIGTSEVDRIAGVLLTALRDTGALSQ